MIGAGERDDGRELVKCAGGCCAPGVGLYPHELDESGLCSPCREDAVETVSEFLIAISEAA
jgi:hypothetical protein